MEAIVLAGGLGKRLRSVVQSVPKPMAPIGSRPFLAVLLDYLLEQGVERVILSVGYRAEQIQDYFGDRYRTCQLHYSVETSPLGTGGAVRQALHQVESEQVLLINGDTLFQVPLGSMLSFHQAQQADLTLALKPMQHGDRYGNVLLQGTRVRQFEEKQYRVESLINGGVYLLRSDLLNALDLSGLSANVSANAPFSLETDVIEPALDALNVQGFVVDQYFIDIGIPADFERAQVELGALV
jgi:D-glycero-alpha-D-manno-heptose 1-phosphate guanylyltransferase